MRGMRLLACAALAAVVGCSHTDTASAPSPPSASQTVPPSGGSIYPVPTKSSSPAPSPNPMHGSSSAKIEGPEGLDLSLNFNTLDPYSFYAGPGSSSSLAFMDLFMGEVRGTLTLGGTVEKGTFKTSPDFGLTMFVTGHPPIDPITITSGDGRCRVTIDTATTWRTTSTVAGSFRCNDVVGGRDVAAGKNVLVSVTGTFTGTVPSAG